ncbi:HlyD family secretion protein [Maioricimonas rarisocia]|uniref:HlyD family secretion protein n=1 Tax=Maioricimonas rarisocia TaxID=2528026 RepID=A0A517Z2D4_9PLAN|nr:HlyD family efflux transporter periplasmic adaptor subunit [Maioricimonas rarisocia]QDU36628.1 HlyD family secretion protein [Maioricimonas rarisocia]
MRVADEPSALDTFSEPAPPPASRGRILFVLAVALAAGIGVARWINHHGGPTFQGRLTAHTTVVTANRSGMVADVLAAEGARVRIGDPLVTLSDSELQERIEQQTAEVARRKVELQTAQAQAALEIEWRQRAIDNEIHEVRLASAGYLKEKYEHELHRSMLADVLTSSEIASLDDGSDAFKSLITEKQIPADRRISTMLQLEAAANAAEVSSARIEMCDSDLKRLSSMRERMPELVRDASGVDVAESRLAEATALLERLQARETSLTVHSPAIAVVGLFVKRPGDRVQPGDVIVELLDDARCQLTVDVPSQHIDDFTLGRELTLTFPGSEVRTGRVASIAPQARPQANATGHGDTSVLVRVEQAGELWPTVPIGSRVDVQLAE